MLIVVIIGIVFSMSARYYIFKVWWARLCQLNLSDEPTLLRLNIGFNGGIGMSV